MPIFSLSDLQQRIAAEPQIWRPLVFTNGCFDLLHAGHVRYLQAAKACGKTLVVGLNSDSSVQQIKPTKPGQPPRPIVTEAQRAEVVAALRAVDGVVIFGETTASQVIFMSRGAIIKSIPCPKRQLCKPMAAKLSWYSLKCPAPQPQLFSASSGTVEGNC
jgi:rfaE bifunctional protein nucleotidyltransferase chain/domain